MRICLLLLALSALRCIDHTLTISIPCFSAACSSECSRAVMRRPHAIDKRIVECDNNPVSDMKKACRCGGPSVSRLARGQSQVGKRGFFAWRFRISQTAKRQRYPRRRHGRHRGSAGDTLTNEAVTNIAKAFVLYLQETFHKSELSVSRLGGTHASPAKRLHEGRGGRHSRDGRRASRTLASPVRRACL